MHAMLPKLNKTLWKLLLAKQKIFQMTDLIVYHDGLPKENLNAAVSVCVCICVCNPKEKEQVFINIITSSLNKDSN